MVPPNLPSLKSLSISDTVTTSTSTCTASTTTTNVTSGSVQSSSNAWPSVASCNSDDPGPAAADASEANCKNVPVSNVTSPTSVGNVNDSADTKCVSASKSTSSSPSTTATTCSSSSVSSSSMVTSISGISSSANTASGLNIHTPVTATLTDSQSNSSSCSNTVSSANGSFFPPPQLDACPPLSQASVTSTSTNQPLSSTTKASFSSSVYRSKKDDPGPSSKFNANIIPSEKIVEFDKMLARETVQRIDWTSCVDEIDYDQDLNFVIDEDSSVSGKKNASAASGKATGASSSSSSSNATLSSKSQVNVASSNNNSSSDAPNEATSTSVTTCSSNKVTSSVTTVTAPVSSSTATAHSTITTTSTTNSSSTAKVTAKRTSSTYGDEYARDPPSSGRVLYDPKKSNGSNMTHSIKQSSSSSQQQGPLPNSNTCQTSNPSGSSDRRISENQRPRRISRSSIEKYDVNHSSAREGNDTSSSSSYRNTDPRDMLDRDRDREYSSSSVGGHHSSGNDHRSSDKNTGDSGPRAPARHLNNHGGRDAPRSNDYRHVSEYHRHDRDNRNRGDRERDDRVSSNYDRSSNYISRTGLSGESSKDRNDRTSHDDRPSFMNRDRDRLDHNRDRDGYLRADRLRDRNDRDRGDRDRGDRDSKYRRENQLAPRFQKLQQQQRLQHHLNVEPSSSSSLPSHQDSKSTGRDGDSSAAKSSSTGKKEPEGAPSIHTKNRTSSTSGSSETSKGSVRLGKNEETRDTRTSQRSSVRSSESSQSTKYATEQETKGASDASRASQTVTSTNSHSQSKVVNVDTSSRSTVSKSNANASASAAAAAAAVTCAPATGSVATAPVTTTPPTAPSDSSSSSAGKSASKSGNESNVIKSSSNSSLNQHKNHQTTRHDETDKIAASGSRPGGADGKNVLDENKKKQQSSQLTYLPPHSEARREQQRRDSRTSSEKSVDVTSRVSSSRDKTATSDPSYGALDSNKNTDGPSKNSHSRDYVPRGASSALIESSSSSRRPIKDQVYKPQGTVIFENKKLREQNAQLDKSVARNSSNRNVGRLNHVVQDDRSIRSTPGDQVSSSIFIFFQTSAFCSPSHHPSS